MGGRASVPLRSRSWDYRVRGLVLTAPGPKGGLPGPGEGESLQALSPVALSSLGTGQDRPAGTPQRALSLPVAAEEIEAQRKEGPRVTGPGREPRPCGSQSSRLATGAAPLQLLGSPSTLGLFPHLAAVCPGQAGRPVALVLWFCLWPRAPGRLGSGSGM